MIECGFFDSVNRDRLYRAQDMTRPYELLVSNGVFATPSGTPSNYLQVYAGTGMGIVVKPGRGIFADKWLVNDSDFAITLAAPEVVLSRIDSIIVRIDTSESVRTGTIMVKKGTPASTPVAPVMTRSEDVNEYRLADITVRSGVSTIVQADIRDMRGSQDCGWITSLVQQVDTSTLYDQWKDAFDTWFAELHETIATQTLIRTFTSVHTTLVQDETVIPINISQFNSELDILQVYINGLMLIRGVEYTIAEGNHTEITLTNGVDVGTPISFVVYKSVDGSEAETVVGAVFELQNIVEKSRATSETGGVKVQVNAGSVLDAFLDLGTGLHTFYSGTGATDSPVAGGSYRYIGHITSTTSPHNGWVLAMSTTGSVFTNVISAGVWRGWRSIYSSDPDPLYFTANGGYPNGGVTITPTKPLSQCANGWVMIWTGYDPDNSEPRDVYTQTVYIPKKSYKNANWNGESMTFSLVYHYNASTQEVNHCVKTLFLYDDRFVSGDNNNVGINRNMVIRAIYEY